MGMNSAREMLLCGCGFCPIFVYFTNLNIYLTEEPCFYASVSRFGIKIQLLKQRPHGFW